MHIFGRVAYCCNSLRLLKLIGVFVKYYHFAPETVAELIHIVLFSLCAKRFLLILSLPPDTSLTLMC